MISRTLDRCEIKENQESCESFINAINAIVEDVSSEPCITLSETELRVFDAFNLMRQEFLDLFMSHKPVKNRVNLQNVLSVLKRVIADKKESGVLRSPVVLSVEE